MAERDLANQLDQAVQKVLAHRSLHRPASLPEADSSLTELLGLAAELCGLPRTDFKARLKSDLERRALMSTKAKAAPEARKVRPVPEGYHTVAPYLCVSNAASAIEFYKQALGATEAMRLGMPDGRIGHAEIQIGDSRIMLSDEFPEYGNRSPESLGGSPAMIHLYVEDVDALAAQVSAAGVRVAVENQDYGERSGGFKDPFGHNWNISSCREEMTSEEYRRRMKQPGAGSGHKDVPVPPAKPVKPVREGFHTVTPHLTVADGSKAIEFYKKAFGATETESMRFVDEDGRIAHSEITLGDSHIMLQGESPQYGKRGPLTLGGSPVMIHLYVEDADAFAEQATAAGAKVVIPLADRFYGDRSGRLTDPFGHLWIVSTHIEDVPADEIERRTAAFVSTQSAGTRQQKAQPARTAKSLGGIREGFTSVTPYLTVQPAAALIEFVKEVFGATETLRTTGSAGHLHAEVRIGNSMVMIGGGPGMPSSEKPGALHTYVDDVDGVYQRALRAGATPLHEPQDHDYGERGASAQDAFGNHWYLATPLAGRPVPEGLRSVTPYLHPRSAAKVIDFLKRAFEAEEVDRYAGPDGTIHHASVRIGDSIIEMGEAHGLYQPMPSAIYLYVPDADVAYQRALDAGATSVVPPTDQPYGDRNAFVSDPFGITWYIATHTGEVSP